VALLVVVGTLIAHATQASDPAALTSVNTDPDGGSRLAQLLTANGVGIRRVDNSSDALDAAWSGDVTLFVPAPALMNPYYLPLLRGLPASDRIVLVAPSAYTLATARLPVRGTGSRWATAAVAPDCALPEARRAGEAAVYRVHYEPQPGEGYLRCYGDALLGVRTGRAEVLLVGASDPFRNDRIGEYGNAALATGLLSTHTRVLWLELDGNDQPPPGGTPGTTGPPSTPHTPDGTERGDGGGGGAGGGNGGGGSTSGADSSPSLPVPRQFWAVVALLVAAAVAVAVAAARRLGPPVAEPLPVTVRGLETVTGRGRLYRRAGARGPALDMLRAAALRRLVPALDLGRDPAPSTVVDALAARTGRSTEQLAEILYGPEPTTDPELVHAVEELDALMREAFPDVARGESG
jgi:hypothetical protein